MASWRRVGLVGALLSGGCDGAEAPAEPPPTEARAEATSGAPAVADTDPAALEARRVAIRAQIKELIGDLTAAGRYDCCVEAPCNLCATRAGGCRCGEGLRNGEPVCEECAMMWRRGNGAEPGVAPESVRSFLEAEREMEARAKGEAPGCSCPEHKPAAPPVSGR